MQGQVITSSTRLTVALADYDFLRATYDVLLRAAVPSGRTVRSQIGE